MGQILSQWNEPAAAWKVPRESTLRSYVLSLIVFVAVVGEPIYFLSRHDHNLYRVFGTVFGILLVSFMLSFLQRIVPATYFIADEGIRYANGYRRFECRWENIEWYTVHSINAMPGPECVTFKLKNADSGRLYRFFPYDPLKIDKTELLRILQERLPQKESIRTLKKDNPFNDLAP